MSDSLSATEDMVEEMAEKLRNASDSIMDMESLYGSFFLGEEEFAFHIKEMQEVVNFPERINRLPLMPDYVVGVFNLRDAIVPLINLRKILRISERPEGSDSGYVGIVRVNDQLIGVQLDRTGDVLMLASDDIAKVEQRKGNSVVCGLANLDLGKRIIRVLSAPSFIELEDMPILRQKVKDNRSSAGFGFMTGVGGEWKTAISFSSEGTEFALPVESILEILEKPQLENSHVAYDSCLGILNLRGTLISVIDFRTAMGSSSHTDLSTGMVIVVIHENRFCGFLVDTVTDVFDFNDESVIAIPVLKDNRRKGCLKGVVPVSEDRDVFLVDCASLCEEDDIRDAINANSVPDALGKGDSVGMDILRSSSSGEASQGELKVFITFRLGKTLAVEILEVNEIIAFPDDLMEPPGYDGYIRGMLNLRGRVIPIVDMRKYYGMDDYKDLQDTSVLIVNHGSSMYGLLVDAVDDSVDVYSSQTTVIPKVMNDSANAQYRGDVSRIIEYRDLEGSENTLMVYSVENLLRNLVGSRVA